MRIDVNVPAMPFAANQHVQYGLVYGSQDGAYGMSVHLNSGPPPSGTRGFQSLLLTNATPKETIEAVTGSTHATLRLRWEAAWGILHAEFDQDGPENGQQWTVLASRRLADHGWTDLSGWSVSVYAHSDNLAVHPIDNFFGDNFVAEYLQRELVLEIGSLTTNGRLTFTNAFTNALYSVQWASGIRTVNIRNGTNVWLWEADAKDNWDSLQNFMVTGQTATVEVPMFYRVKCVTNLLWPMPTGSWWLQRGSNVLGQVWTNRGAVVGRLYLPWSGKEYSIIEQIFSQSPYSPRLIAGRSSGTAFYLGMDCGEEDMRFTDAPVGTCWTNTVCGQVTAACIETNENVTVPAGTFPCVRVRKRLLGTSDPNPVWIEWWSPGVGSPKWIDYIDYADGGQHAPIVYEWISFMNNSK